MLSGVILVLIIIIGLGTGYFQFYTAYIRCGKAPIMVHPGSSFASGYSPGYYTKDDGFHYKPGWNHYYFCTEKEAQQNGIKPGLFSKEKQE